MKDYNKIPDFNEKVQITVKPGYVCKNCIKEIGLLSILKQNVIIFNVDIQRFYR